MHKKFIDYHLLRILESFEETARPLDFFLSQYFKKNKALGARDRRTICEKLYILVRHKLLIDAFLATQQPVRSKTNSCWENRLTYLNKHIFLQKERKSPETPIESGLITKFPPLSSLPFHLQVSFPEPIFQTLANDYNVKKALEICQILNQQAPFTIRANTLKISPNKLAKIFLQKYGMELSKNRLAKNALSLQKRQNLFALPEFKKGLFEMQDEGSQLIAEFAPFTKGQRILDYCAGSGGKTLAFAPKLENKGQIFLYDIRPAILKQAKKRLKRAGIQNAQIATSYEKLLKQKLFDGIFLDVPCSGFGTLRRNPDMKYKLNLAELQELVQKQRQIFKKAFALLKKGGCMLYATCSIFKQENEDQIKFFLENYPLRLMQEPLKLLPLPQGPDGFFAAALQKL